MQIFVKKGSLSSLDDESFQDWRKNFYKANNVREGGFDGRIRISIIDHKSNYSFHYNENNKKDIINSLHKINKSGGVLDNKNLIEYYKFSH